MLASAGPSTACGFGRVERPVHLFLGEVPGLLAQPADGGVLAAEDVSAGLQAKRDRESASGGLPCIGNGDAGDGGQKLREHTEENSYTSHNLNVALPGGRPYQHAP